MTEDDYIMISAAAAVFIIIIQRRNTERRMTNFVDQKLSEDLIRPICLTRRRENDIIWRVVIIRRFYWLIEGPHLHSRVDSRSDSWMNVLTMQLLVRSVGWIWHIWFVRLVGPTGRTSPFTRFNCRTNRSYRPVGPTGRSDRSVRPVGPTGRSDRSVRQLDRVNAALLAYIRGHELLRTFRELYLTLLLVRKTAGVIYCGL